MADRKFKYSAFLTYNRQDNSEQRPGAPEVRFVRWADWLCTALTDFSIPPNFIGQLNSRGEIISPRLGPIFPDQPPAAGGEDKATLTDDQRHALDESQCLIVICSPRAAVDPRINEVVRYFKQLGRGQCIFPIVVAGEPNAGEKDRPGISPHDECFAPAMRHPVTGAGALDLSRRERGYIFADARQGEDKQEIPADGLRNAETELEIAKIQLIAAISGIAFNGLMTHEQKRRFVGFSEAQYLAREAQNQLQEARNQARDFESQARETLSQLEQARLQAREAQAKALETQNLPQDAKTQIQEAQDKALEAQEQAREARAQLQAMRDRAGDIQRQLDDARREAREMEARLIEAQQQARESQNQIQHLQNQALLAQSQFEQAQGQANVVQSQLAEARDQVRAAEARVLEAQGLANHAQTQLEEARAAAHLLQENSLEAQNLSPDAAAQLREAQTRAVEAQEKAQSAQGQLQALQSQVLGTQGQLDEARKTAQQAEANLLAAQNTVREIQNQVAEAQHQAQEAGQQLEEYKNRLRDTESQLDAARAQARDAEAGMLQAQRLAQETQGRLDTAHRQAQESQDKLQALQNLARETEHRVKEAEAQLVAAREEARDSQNQFQRVQQKIRGSRRLLKAFAVLAVLALLADGIATFTAIRQRQRAGQPPAPAALAANGQPDHDLAATPSGPAQITEALQRLAGPAQASNQWRGLDELAVNIPANEIDETLRASSIIVADSQRRRFQKQLLTRLIATDPLAAMTNAGAIDGTGVHTDGASGSPGDFEWSLLGDWAKRDLPGALDWARHLPDPRDRDAALAIITPALASDNPTNALVALNQLQPAPGDQIYQSLFQCWAASDPVQALQNQLQTPGHDAGNQIFSGIVSTWAGKDPDAAWAWVQSQPDSEAKNRALEICLQQQSATDFPKAIDRATSLPEGAWRNLLIAGLFDRWATNDLAAATAACLQLPNGAAKQEAWQCVLSRRIAADPASAAGSVTNLGPGLYRQKAIEQLSQAWAGTNTPAALAWAQSLPSDAERIAACRQVIDVWSRQDPSAAIAFAEQAPESFGSAVSEIAAAWAQKDPTSATNWVQNLPNGEKKDAAWLAMADSLSRQKPDLAAAFCLMLTTSQPPQAIVQAIARSYATNDLPAAVTWVRGLTNGIVRDDALSALSDAWAKTDPKGMATYALGLPADDNARPQCLAAACRQLASHDFPGTAELLKTLPDADLRQSILQQAAQACDFAHLDQAAKYVADLPPGPDQKAAIDGLLAHWAVADPASALTWLCSFPETNSQPEKTQSLIKDWSRTEPAAAADWLAHAPAAVPGDQLITAFLGGATAKYPEFAARWSQSITNQTKRQKFQIQIGQQWMKSDPAAASNWINTLDWPDDIKQPLRAQSR